MTETTSPINEDEVFTDPSTNDLKAQWLQDKSEALRLMDTVCDELYEQRLKYHGICQTPNPEDAARADLEAKREALEAELKERLASLWSRTVHLVGRLVEDLKTEGEE